MELVQPPSTAGRPTAVARVVNILAKALHVIPQQIVHIAVQVAVLHQAAVLVVILVVFLVAHAAAHIAVEEVHAAAVRIAAEIRTVADLVHVAVARIAAVAVHVVVHADKRVCKKNDSHLIIKSKIRNQ